LKGSVVPNTILTHLVSEIRFTVNASSYITDLRSFILVWIIGVWVRVGIERDVVCASGVVGGVVVWVSGVSGVEVGVVVWVIRIRGVCANTGK